MDTSFCLEALPRLDRPEIFNTDQGSQFTGEPPKRGKRTSHEQQQGALAESGRLNFDAVYYSRRIGKLAA